VIGGGPVSQRRVRKKREAFGGGRKNSQKKGNAQRVKRSRKKRKSLAD